MSSTPYTLERGDDIFDLIIEYSVAPYDPGCAYGPPEYCDPPSGGEVEDMDAYLDGAPFALTNAERAEIEKYIYDVHESLGDLGDAEDYYENAFS